MVASWDIFYIHATILNDLMECSLDKIFNFADHIVTQIIYLAFFILYPQKNSSKHSKLTEYGIYFS